MFDVSTQASEVELKYSAFMIKFMKHVASKILLTYDEVGNSPMKVV